MHSYFTFIYFYPRRKYSVDNILCFISGIYYSILKIYLDKIFMKNDILYFGNVTFLIILYYNYYSFTKRNVCIVSVTNCLFSLYNYINFNEN